MNRTGRWCCCWPQRRRSMYLLLLTTTLVALASCEEQQRPGTNALDPDVAGVRAFFDDILGAGTSRHGNAVRQTRTFGHKRIQFMMMPMVYKMGVMMTMLTVLTIISLKGLMIGVALLVLKLSAIFGKLYASHQSSGYGHASAGWTPPQPVHVHVHNSGGYGAHSQAYSGWESAAAASGPPDDHYYYKG